MDMITEKFWKKLGVKPPYGKKEKGEAFGKKEAKKIDDEKAKEKESGE